MDAGGLTNGVDRIEAGFDKSTPDVEFEATKRLAGLPVGTVENAHHSLPCRRLACSSFYGSLANSRGARKPPDRCPGKPPQFTPS